jgi:chitinase
VRPYFKQGFAGAEECFKAGASKKKKRQNNSIPKGDYSGFEEMPNLTDRINKEAMGNIQAPEINCYGCGSCVVTVKVNNICCGCAWLPPDYDEQGSMYLSGSPVIGTMKRTVFDQPMTHRLESRSDKFGINMGKKPVTFWETQPFFLNSDDPYRVYSEFYPAFPDYYRNPLSTANWDASKNAIGVKVYFHNTSNACQSFDVTQSATYDWEYPWPKQGYAPRGQKAFQYVQGQRYHAQYQTEHVFEGQTIARFFSSWLPYSAATRRQKYWTEAYILSTNTQWSNKADRKFINAFFIPNPASRPGIVCANVELQQNQRHLLIFSWTNSAPETSPTA